MDCNTHTLNFAVLGVVHPLSSSYFTDRQEQVCSMPPAQFCTMICVCVCLLQHHGRAVVSKYWERQLWEFKCRSTESRLTGQHSRVHCWLCHLVGLKVRRDPGYRFRQKSPLSVKLAVTTSSLCSLSPPPPPVKPKPETCTAFYTGAASFLWADTESPHALICCGHRRAENLERGALGNSWKWMSEWPQHVVSLDLSFELCPKPSRWIAVLLFVPNVQSVSLYASSLKSLNC